MLDSLAALIAPHSCLACRRLGELLCAACTVELADARTVRCLLCGIECDDRGLCGRCAPTLPVERAFLFGERDGVPEVLVNQFKFHRKRSAYRHVGELLAGILPYRLPTGTVIVPLPTILAHIRQRGYDHTLLVARDVARRKRVRVAIPLRRDGPGVQHGANKRDRIAQASRAFTVPRPLDPDALYLLVDDIVTTGSSLRFAARALCDAGAKRIWVLALARQPLDGQGSMV